MKSPLAHIVSGCNNSQKRVELSALTQDSEQSAMAEGDWPSASGCSERGANIPFS